MWLHLFLWLLTITYFLVILSSVIIVILENKQPVKTMAWVMVLLSFPVIGLLIFYFFGQNIRKERILSRRTLNLLLRKEQQQEQQEEQVSPEAYERLVCYFRSQNHAHLSFSNESEFYTDGAAFLESLINAIRLAQHHIHLESYIIEDGHVGRMVLGALAEAVKRGVIVRVLYDDVGCWKVDKHFFNEMRERGIEAIPFLPVLFPRFTRKINYRNHRKICVIDGTIGFIGGMNLADRYVSDANGMQWKDFHLRLNGPAVHGLQQTFLLDWYFITHVLINDSIYYPIMSQQSSGQLVQIVTSSPSAHYSDIMNGLIWMIQNAKKYIYLATPYFMPTEPILSALQIAASSGVDVRLMVTEKPDGLWLKLANESYYSDILDAGVKLYLYHAGFHHSKFAVADDAIMTAGSTNIDFRSFENNFEVNAFVYDVPSARRMKRIFLEDQSRSKRISATEWAKRPHSKKFKESFVRIFSPLF